MAKLARVPATDALKVIAFRPRRVGRSRPRYYAFLSYSHRDDEIADWLHKELEQFRVPPALAGKLTENGVIPKRLTPIFRDEHELAAADDLSEEIETALASSQYLIVLCSPNAAKSRWTNAEIELFKRIRPDGCVLAAIASGEPFASDIPGRSEEECFPPALRQRYDRRGRPTGKRAEPLAADLRESGDGRRLGFLKLVAGMLGVGLDDLVQRETTRRHRRMAWLAAASLAGMAVTSTLAFTAIQARDAARDQRREAEGLVAFMLGDLKDKLEPIGRLDALDGVGTRVLAYYSKQDTSQLSDAALLQRSRALSLTAEVSNLRGNLDTADRLYREALTGTGEAIRRNPSDPQRLFDHAQNVFAIGEIARQRGDGRSQEAAAREYKRLAITMVSLGPDNMKWRMEEQYADANLGIAFFGQRRFAEATGQFQQALQRIESLAAADPGNSDYQQSVAESLAWIADARMSEGRLGEASAFRKRELDLLKKLLNGRDSDVQILQMVTPAEQALGRLNAMKGEGEAALEHLRAAVASADQLVRIEPSNTFWREQGLRARLALAEFAWGTGQKDEAIDQTAAACDAVRQLLRQDGRAPTRRAGLADCAMLQARIALANGAKPQSMSDAVRAVDAARSVKSNDRATDQYRIAKAYRLLGDVQKASGDAGKAFDSWSAALRSLPHGLGERPAEMDEHALILQRVGRTDEAQQILTKLNAMGYRQLS